MKRSADGCGQRSAAGLWLGLAAVAVAALAAAPASAAGYVWHGGTSSDWGTPANWGSNNMAPTGGTFDATLYITNRAFSRLVYSEANGTTIYTSSASPSRCLRIADGANGSLAVTGGFLETRGTAGDFVGNSFGTGQLLIDGGTYVSTNATFNLGANNAVATLTVSNGFTRLGTLNLWCSVGTVNLIDGTLGFGSMTLNAGAGSASMNLNGGTLQAWRNTGAWMLSATNWSCRLNGSVVFDTPDCYVTNAAPINGSGTLTKVGSGLLALNVSNTIAAVTVNEGALSLGGSNTISGGVTLNAGALNVNHAAALGSSALTINGGRIDNITAAAVSNVLGGPINICSNFTYGGTRELNLGTGAVTLCNSIMVTNLAKTLTLGGTVTDGGSNYTLTVTGSGMLNLTGCLGIGGRLTVAGSGSLTWAGANTYTGATTVSAGILYVAHSGALGATNGTTSVSIGSKIQMMQGVAVEGESLYLTGGGENWGALQAAANSTSAWNGPVILNENNPAGWSPRLGHKSTGVLSVGGPISAGVGGAGIHLWISGEPGIGRVIIAGTNNTYSGITGIIRGTLALGADNALPVVTKIDMHPASSVTADYSKFDLNGFSQTIGALSESSATAPRMVTNSSATASTLTLNQTANTVYAGRIDGNVSLVKDGAGSLTLAGTDNTYTGTTTLKNGTLALDANGALSPSTALTLSGGTLSAGPWTNALQQLTVSGTCTIDLGDGTGRLEFADSSGQPWSGTLNLVGTLGLNTVRFGTSSSALTQQQLGLIRLNGMSAWLALGPDGYLHTIKGTLFMAF